MAGECNESVKETRADMKMAVSVEEDVEIPPESEVIVGGEVSNAMPAGGRILMMEPSHRFTEHMTV